MKRVYGPFWENTTVVLKICSRTKMWDVGCDRMVIAINSDLFLIKFNSEFNKWSLEQGQKTVNQLIPSFRKDY